jgi:hypothetical protein
MVNLFILIELRTQDSEKVKDFHGKLLDGTPEMDLLEEL